MDRAPFATNWTYVDRSRDLDRRASRLQRAGPGIAVEDHDRIGRGPNGRVQGGEGDAAAIASRVGPGVEKPCRPSHSPADEPDYFYYGMYQFLKEITSDWESFAGKHERRGSWVKSGVLHSRQCL